MPGQVIPKPELVDETDGVAIRLEEVVVELLEPRTVRSRRLEPARQPASQGFALEHGDLVAARGGDAGQLEAGGAAAEDEHAPRVGDRDERALAPLPLAADLGVVDALDAAAGDDAPPAVVGGDAPADVVLASLAHLLDPLGVGEELAGEEDRVSLARRCPEISQPMSL